MGGEKKYYFEDLCWDYFIVIPIDSTEVKGECDKAFYSSHGVECLSVPPEQNVF